MRQLLNKASGFWPLEMATIILGWQASSSCPEDRNHTHTHVHAYTISSLEICIEVLVIVVTIATTTHQELCVDVS